MDTEKIALMIPILAILLGVATAIIAIVTSHREKQKRVELRHRERLAAIEKGIELTPDPEPDAGVKKTGSLKTGLTGIFVTHDMVEALRLGDRIAVLHEGRLLQVGTPADLLREPADERVADLMRTPRRQAEALEALLGERSG